MKTKMFRFTAAAFILAFFTAVPMRSGLGASDGGAIALSGACAQTCNGQDGNCWWQGCDPDPYDVCAGEYMFEVQQAATCARPSMGCV